MQRETGCRSELADELTAEEAQEVAQVCASSATRGQVYELVQEFGPMVRVRKRAKPDGWLQRALESGVEELARFARGLQGDYAAVAAALEFAFSNGPTEGHVNRLEVVKRMMLGRAKFDLLRKRVLCAQWLRLASPKGRKNPDHSEDNSYRTVR